LTTLEHSCVLLTTMILAGLNSALVLIILIQENIGLKIIFIFFLDTMKAKPRIVADAARADIPRKYCLLWSCDIFLEEPVC
jgi:hypothetical protein